MNSIQIKMHKLNTFVFIDLKVLMNILHKILLQKIGGMFQEALAMPAPVMNQASPAPSQGIIDTTSYPLQSHGGISFSQSQVGMHVLQFLSLAKPYMHTYAWNAPNCYPWPHHFTPTVRIHFSGQWQLPDAISGGAKTGAAQSIGVQQHVLFPVGED